MEKFFVALGAAVVIYYGTKLLLFSRMLFPKLWFPLTETFFTSMGEWAGEAHVRVCVCRYVCVDLCTPNDLHIAECAWTCRDNEQQQMFTLDH